MKQYYHDFKICILFGGLDECMEGVMNRFMKGLNSEIEPCYLASHIAILVNCFVLLSMLKRRIYYL
jgi:hypothetical protein